LFSYPASSFHIFPRTAALVIVRDKKNIMSFVVVSLRDINKRIVVKSAWIHFASKKASKNNKYFPVYYHPDFAAPANFLLKEKFDKHFDPSREGLFFGRIEKTFGKLKIIFSYEMYLEHLSWIC
jgi:hypothetical protein